MPEPGNESKKLPSGLPAVIADEELLARFLTSRGQFNTLGPKPSAFLPTKFPLETSVTRHDGEPEDELWALGEPLRSSIRRDLKGAAFIPAGKVRETGLSAESDEPPDRHAAIRKWPVDTQDPESEKAKKKDLAVMLVEHSTIKLKN